MEEIRYLSQCPKLPQVSPRRKQKALTVKAPKPPSFKLALTSLSESKSPPSAARPELNSSGFRKSNQSSYSPTRTVLNQPFPARQKYSKARKSQYSIVEPDCNPKEAYDSFSCAEKSSAVGSDSPRSYYSNRSPQSGRFSATNGLRRLPARFQVAKSEKEKKNPQLKFMIQNMEQDLKFILNSQYQKYVNNRESGENDRERNTGSGMDFEENYRDWTPEKRFNL
jgi:hypothetical protein